MFETRTVLDEMSDNNVKDMFWLKRQGVMEVYHLAAEEIEPLTRRTHAISAIVRFLAILNYLARGNFQPSCACIIGISHPSLS